MRVSEIIDKVSSGDLVYVVSPMNIRWNSMRFEQTSIVYATYVVVESESVDLWGNHRTTYLKIVDSPVGTKNYPRTLSNGHDEYQCFKTKEEAEIWKIIELQDLEKRVNHHIELIKEKTSKKIKSLKRKERFDEYMEKYPDKFLKVL